MKKKTSPAKQPSPKAVAQYSGAPVAFGVNTVKKVAPRKKGK